MALATQPRFLLDEPTSGLGSEKRRATSELMRPIRGGCALVIVEHDPNRLTALGDGRAPGCGSVEEIERSSAPSGVVKSWRRSCSRKRAIFCDHCTG